MQETTDKIPKPSPHPPMHTTASVIMETEPVSEHQTNVRFINSGTLKYPMNIFYSPRRKTVSERYGDEFSNPENPSRSLTRPRRSHRLNRLK